MAFDAGDFHAEADGIDNDAISDDVNFVIPEDAGGEEVEDVFCAFGDDGVACVISALAADDDVCGFGEVIDNFAFSFVAPLEAGDDCIHVIFNRE